MKCEFCGADYPADELRCPYCKAPNPTGVQWKFEEGDAENRMRFSKEEALKKTPFQVANRVVNVLLLVLVAANALLFVGAAMFFFTKEKVDDRKTARADYDEALAYYKAQDFDALEAYLDEYHIDASQEKYRVFIEAVNLDREYYEFMDDWMRYEKYVQENDLTQVPELEEGEQYNNPFQVDDILQACNDILQKRMFYFECEYLENNEEVYNRLKEAATLFLAGEFGYTEEEIENLYDNEEMQYGEFKEKVIPDAYERKGWYYDVKKDET